MEKIDYKLITGDEACTFNSALLGTPPENRILIAVNTEEKRTQSGLVLPQKSEEEIPKKGVVVAKGPTNEDPTHEMLNIGDVIHYGKFAGKEILPSFKPNLFLNDPLKDTKFYVMSSSEIIFIEPNPNN